MSEKSPVANTLPVHKKMLVACFRISLLKSNTNFKHNPTFSLCFLDILGQTIRYCENIKECLHITQQSNLIFIYFNRDKSPINSSLLKKLEVLVDTLRQNNNLQILFREKKDFLLISTAITQGYTKINTDYAAHPLFHDMIWLGDLKEQALLLAKVSGTRNFPNFLITDAVYQELSPSYQKKFNRKYYHDHICCYAPATATIDKPGCYWHSEYCGVGKNLLE